MSASNDAPAEERKSEPEMRYVLSGQSTGWAAMAKEVRDFDEEKVRECKEDIDTLFVFAGLFSAVLSAFVVAAYPSLQPDRMDMVVYTLQRIATQTASYELSENKLTATQRLPESPPVFEPASGDIRINILWFASLVISLVTASLAILVKQWLREFLAVANPSPLARVRIRHLREPGIRGWKVYEIAAILPLFLQLSLGLFFVGLCYFTAAIHSSIGYTTLPLVVGWALFLFTATLLPLYFPRCPYRTAILKGTIASIHRKFRLLGLYYDPSGDSSRWKRMTRAVLGRGLIAMLKSIPDEEIIVDAEEADLDILASVDAIQGNDDLLPTTIAEAVRYTRPEWQNVVGFIVHLIAHRTPSNASGDRFPDWPFKNHSPLARLRPRAIKGVLTILSQSISTDATSLYYGSGYQEYIAENNAYASLLEHGQGYGLHPTFLAFCIVLSCGATADGMQILSTDPRLQAFLRGLLDSYLAPSLVHDCLHLDRELNHIGPPTPLQFEGAMDALLYELVNVMPLTGPSIAIGAQCFEEMWRLVIDYPRYYSASPASFEPLDWNVMRWPDNFSGQWQVACLRYLFTLTREEFKRLAVCATEEPLAPEATVVLNTSLRLAAAMGHTTRDLWENMREVIVLALQSQPSTCLLLDALIHNPRSQWFDLYHRCKFSLEKTNQAPVTVESVDILRSAVIASSSQESMSLSGILDLCGAAILLFFFVVPDGPDAHCSARSVFSSIHRSIHSLLTDPNVVMSSKTTKHLDNQAYTCLRSMAHVDLAGQEILTDGFDPTGAIFKDWLEEFVESESLFSDELVDILGQLHVTHSAGHRHILHRLRRLDELARNRAREQAKNRVLLPVRKEHIVTEISGVDDVPVPSSEDHPATTAAHSLDPDNKVEWKNVIDEHVHSESQSDDIVSDNMQTELYCSQQLPPLNTALEPFTQAATPSVALHEPDASIT